MDECCGFRFAYLHIMYIHRLLYFLPFFVREDMSIRYIPTVSPHASHNHFVWELRASESLTRAPGVECVSVDAGGCTAAMVVLIVSPSSEKKARRTANKVLSCEWKHTIIWSVGKTGSHQPCKWQLCSHLKTFADSTIGATSRTSMNIPGLSGTQKPLCYSCVSCVELRVPTWILPFPHPFINSPQMCTVHCQCTAFQHKHVLNLSHILTNATFMPTAGFSWQDLESNIWWKFMSENTDNIKICSIKASSMFHGFIENKHTSA